VRGLVVRHAWWVVGLLLVATGVAAVLTTPEVATQAGWFAYTPLDPDAVEIGSDAGPTWSMSWPDAGWLVTPRHLLGGGVVVAGLLLLAAGAAYRLGRRRGAAG
jgi:hypothetical protein